MVEIDQIQDKLETEFKKGFTKPLILTLLGEKKNFAYALAKDISKRTKGRINIAVPNIYPILKDLHKNGLVIRRKSDGSKRIFYELTADGVELGKKIKQSIFSFTTIFQDLIGDSHGKK